MLAAAASRTHAGTADAAPPMPPTPEQLDTLPFSDAELQQALLARLLGQAGEPALLRIDVKPAGAGAVAVRVGARSRIVALNERTGAGAARVVALVIAEILNSGVETPPAGETPTTADAKRAIQAPSRTASGTVVPHPTLAATGEPTAAPEWKSRLCLTSGAAKGTGDEELLAGTLDVDLTMAFGHGRLRLAPSAGLTIMPTRNAGTLDQVSFLAVSGRLLGGATFGPLDFLGGPVVSRYSIGGATPHGGLLVGAEGVARLAAPLSDRFRLVAAARVDGFADRVRVFWVDGRAYATPRVELGVGVGLAWEWAS